MNIKEIFSGALDLFAKYQAWHKRYVFSEGRLKFYRDCVDSKLMLREYAAARASQMESRNNPMHEAVWEIARKLAAGKSAADSFKGTAPDSDVALIDAYEKNNRLAEGLNQVIQMVTEQNALKSLVKKSMIGPTIYLCVALGLISFGIPMLIAELGPMLPLESRKVDQVILIAFANFMSVWGVPISVALIASILALFTSLPFWAGPVRRKLDSFFPPLKMYRAYQSALFLKTLAVQLSVTPKLEDALGHIWNNSSPWQRMYIELVQEKLPHHRLEPLTAFDVGFLDGDLIDSLAIISRKGTAEEAIMIRAVESGAVAIDSIEKSISVLKMAATLLAGVLLLWTTYSLVLGLVQVTSMNMNNMQSRPF